MSLSFLLIYFFLGVEYFAFGFLGLFGGFDAIKKFIVNILGQVDFADVHVGACGDHVNLIDASQWTTV